MKTRSVSAATVSADPSSGSSLWPQAVLDGLPNWLAAALPLLLGSLGILLLAYLAMAPSLDGGTLWDDRPLLIEHPDVVAVDGLVRLWKAEQTPDFFPMTMSVAWLEYRLWGDNLFWWRLTNVLLHATCCILGWRVLRQLELPGAWLAAALFAVHPVTVASVAWISELKNVCSLLFATLACWAYLEFDQRGLRRHYALAIVTFLLALLSKTSVVMLPPVLIVLLWWRRAKEERRLTLRELLPLAPLFLSSLMLGLVTVWFQANRVVGDLDVRPEGALSRLASTGWIAWFYVLKDLLPVRLSLVYPRWSVDPSNPLAWQPLLSILAVSMAAWRFRQRGTRGLCVAAAFFLLMLFPVCGWFNTYFSLYSLVSDHWQYLSLWAVVVGVTSGFLLSGRWLCARFLPKLSLAWQHALPMMPLLLLLGVLLPLSRQRAAEFHDEETLWSATIQQNPKAWVAYNNLAPYRVENGDWPEAERLYRRAIELRPDYAVAHNNLGALLSKQRKYDAAIEHLRIATEILPDYHEAWNNWGNTLGRQAHFDEAATCYRRALEISPDYAKGHYNLAFALSKRRNFAEAETHYLRAVEIDPEYALAWNGLGLAHLAGRDYATAMECFDRAIELEPKLVSARRNLARARHEMASAQRYDRYQ